MEQIKIDIVPVGVAPVAHASQFDNGRQIRFNLFNQGTPYTLTGAETVTMVVNGEEENITNTSDNYVIWDVAEEDCAEVGVIGCEIRIVLGSMLIGSKNFFLEVEMDPYDGKNIRIVTVGPADICTFETTLAEPLQSVLVNVLATGGNGTPDNPNPINGYSSANITRCGVNLFNKTDNTIQNNARIATGTGGTYGAAGYSVSPYIKIDNTNSYVLTSGITSYFAGYDENKTFIGGGSWNTGASKTFLATVVYIRFDFQTANIDSIQLEQGSTATAYAPYNGQTYTIAFGQTVYGGQLIILPDRTYFHATWKGVDLGNLNWTYRGPNFPNVFSTNSISDYKFVNDVNALCSIYAFGGTVVGIDNATEDKTAYFYCASGSSEHVLYIKDTAYTDKNTFITVVTGQKLVYELATPFDIDLTPEVISAVVGTNNVFADCGQTTVKYLKAGG